jgi:hypothetical protein
MRGLKEISFATSLLLSGCNMFSTRSPEAPEGGGSQGWNFPATPQITMDDLQSAVGRRSSADYVRVLAAPESSLPEYVFVPDQQTAAANPGAFDGWNLAREMKLAQALFAPVNLPLDSLAVLTISVERQTTLTDTTVFTCNYQMHLGHLLDRVPRDMQGRAEFRMLRANDGGWYIQQWTDTRVTGQACWSDLKAAF